MKHLALFKTSTSDDILSGKIKVEIRFSKTKVPPFGIVSTGDIVYIKPVGKEIIGQFRVKKVIYYDGIEKEDLEDLKDKYSLKLLPKDTKYLTLIFIADSSRFITSPIKMPKKNLRGWVVLE